MPVHRSPPHVTPGAALAACHAAVALFGFAGVFGKWIAWDPVAIVLGRTTIAAIVLAFFVRYRLGAWRAPHWIAVPNGVILAVHWVAFFAAIKVSTVAIGLLGYASFRPGQREAIDTLLDRGRLLLVAPTGGGKSLIYQLPGSLLPGTSITSPSATNPAPATFTRVTGSPSIVRSSIGTNSGKLA